MEWRANRPDSPILHGDVMRVTASAKLGTPALPPPWFPGGLKGRGASRRGGGDGVDSAVQFGGRGEGVG